MINVNDFKTGVTIVLDNNIYQVLEFLHVKPGKGPAFVRSKLKNLRTGSIIDHTFNAGVKVAKAIVLKKKMQYLYNTGEEYFFMDLDTYEQVSLNKNQIEDEINYLKENIEVDLIFYNNEMIGINLPEKVSLLIAKTEPAIKGNTTTNASKDATLETGLIIKVPLFIEEGETIIVSTKENKYVSRK